VLLLSHQLSLDTINAVAHRESVTNIWAYLRQIVVTDAAGDPLVPHLAALVERVAIQDNHHGPVAGGVGGMIGAVDGVGRVSTLPLDMIKRRRKHHVGGNLAG
jgi:hypothetical protein